MTCESRPGSLVRSPTAELNLCLILTVWDRYVVVTGMRTLGALTFRRSLRTRWCGFSNNPLWSEGNGHVKIVPVPGLKNDWGWILRFRLCKSCILMNQLNFCHYQCKMYAFVTLQDTGLADSTKCSAGNYCEVSLVNWRFIHRRSRHSDEELDAIILPRSPATGFGLVVWSV